MSKLINIILAIFAGFGVVLGIYKAGEKSESSNQKIKSLEDDAKFFKRALKAREKNQNLSREQLVDSILRPRKDNL